MAIVKNSSNQIGNCGQKPMHCKVKNKNFIAIALRPKAGPYPDRMQAI